MTPSGRSILVPALWRAATAQNGQGIVFRPPGPAASAALIRIMDPTPLYPAGYAVFYNYYGQPIGLDGRPLRLAYLARYNRAASTARMAAMTVRTDPTASDVSSTLGLSEFEVTSITFDYRVQFNLLNSENTLSHITIAGTMFFNTGDSTFTIDPENTGHVSPLISLLRTSITDVVIDDDGRLLVGFSSGAHIAVPPDPAYEAWEASGPGYDRIVCTPGGTLAVWSSSHT